MIIREVMTRDAKLIHPDDTLQQAAKLMKDCDCGILPVADGDQLVGIVSLSDLARKEPNTAKALHLIARPGEQHNQSRLAA